MDAARSAEVGPASVPAEDAVMAKREITMPDGRYMVFYTFEDEAESR